jgi:DNA repair exonuclease SbcCD ATPase subunit
MPTITFKVSDSQKHDFLWRLLNVNYNEENGWAVEYGICDIYDEYAIVRNYAEAKFERVYYTKNDETDSLEITKTEECFIVDVNATEKAALEVIHKMNENTYEAIDTKFETLTNDLATANTVIEKQANNITEITTQNSEFSTKIEELENNVATLNTEKENAQSLYVELSNKFESVGTELASAQATIATLTTERDELATFRKNIIDTEKRTVIEGYAEQLDAEVIASYIEKMDNYTARQLDMELTYQVKVTRPEMFTKIPTGTTYIPKDEKSPVGGLETLLAKYENKH